MRKLICAVVAGAWYFGVLSIPAHADIISILGYSDGPSTSALNLIAVPPPGNQPLNTPCLICGTQQPQQPANFGYNNYQQGGSQTAFSDFSTAATGNQSLGTDTQGTSYLVSFLRAFLISQLDLNGRLDVGIDVNTGTGQGPEVLERFVVLNTTQHTILADYNPAIGTPLPTANNGTGFPDYILSGFNIDRNDISAGDGIEFYARWSNASDGAESFFLVPVPGALVDTPEPAALAILGVALAALGYLTASRRPSRTGPSGGAAWPLASAATSGETA
jgi:hypothetical protein